MRRSSISVICATRSTVDGAALRAEWTSDADGGPNAGRSGAGDAEADAAEAGGCVETGAGGAGEAEDDEAAAAEAGEACATNWAGGETGSFAESYVCDQRISIRG